MSLNTLALFLSIGVLVALPFAIGRAVDRAFGKHMTRLIDALSNNATTKEEARDAARNSSALVRTIKIMFADDTMRDTVIDLADCIDDSGLFYGVKVIDEPYSLCMLVGVPSGERAETALGKLSEMISGLSVGPYQDITK